MLEKLTRWCYQQRRKVLGLWVLAFIGFVILGQVAGGPFSTNFNTPGSDSKAALELLQKRFPARSGDTVTVVFKADNGINAPGVKAKVDALLADLATKQHVVGTVSPYTPEGASGVSRDGKIAYGELQLDVQGNDVPVPVAKTMIADAQKANGDGVRFELGGGAIQGAEFVQGGGTEGLGILAAMIILLVSFGSLLAMGLPILSAIMGIGIGLAILEILTHVITVPNFSPIVAAMIGIGVGIDYALFIVTRYRQSLHAGQDPETATVTAITTAGKAVLFAGTTVIISVIGLLLMNLPFLQGMAVGSAAAVLVTMIASVTLLPAMLGFVGLTIDKFKLPLIGGDPSKHHRAGFWFRWSRLIQKRPWPAFVAGAAAVLLLAIPLLSMRLGFPGDDAQPESRTSRRSYELLAEGFGPGFNAPLILAVDTAKAGSGVTASLQKLTDTLRAEKGLAFVSPAQPNPAGDAAVVTAIPATSAGNIETERLVNRLRDKTIPQATQGTSLKVYIGGPNAGFLDSSHAISSRLPIFIAVVVGLSFVLLMSVFRSVLVALKAAIMNLLSIAAAYGVLVAVAQWGWGKSIFGIHSIGPIASFIPMMMFAILFGLSMDYEVFLLSRIREEYVRTGENGLAVADGLAATARVITAAALIMITVFLSFVLGPELIIKQIGLGLAAAILVDATLIRMVLVPATMELLGKANWWLPGWLDRILPKVGFEGAGEEFDLDREMQELTAQAAKEI